MRIVAATLRAWMNVMDMQPALILTAFVCRGVCERAPPLIAEVNGVFLLSGQCRARGVLV